VAFLKSDCKRAKLVPQEQMFFCNETANSGRYIKVIWHEEDPNTIATTNTFENTENIMYRTIKTGTIELTQSNPLHPGSMVHKSCQENDIDGLKHGLKKASEYGVNHTSLITDALQTAVSAGHVEIPRFLLETQGALVTELACSSITENPSIELLQLLLDHGLNINKETHHGRLAGPYILQGVCYDETLTRWCLDHGAKIDTLHVDFIRSPPLLESVAGRGSIPTFKLLLERGAKLEGRILHRAVRNVGWNPGTPQDNAAMAMVRYLVDELGLDVNQMDSEKPRGNHYGTPICYAAVEPCQCTEVVKFLLERGADPFIKGFTITQCDAFLWAKGRGNTKVLEILEEWALKAGKKTETGGGTEKEVKTENAIDKETHSQQPNN
jgi:hypothetical protein